MTAHPTRIFPLGENAVTVEFGNEMSVELNAAAVALADRLNAFPFPGFIEALPAIASTTVFYDCRETAEHAVDATEITNARNLAGSDEPINAAAPANSSDRVNLAESTLSIDPVNLREPAVTPWEHKNSTEPLNPTRPTDPPKSTDPNDPSNPTAFDFVKNHIITLLTKTLSDASPIIAAPKTHIIPVSFKTHHAPDLTSLARHSGMSEAEVVEIFTSATYRVFMLGFLPGFAYMGIVDERIAMPRHDTPRTAVPAGSVGIAGRQTGIYPSDSPGGWQIVGRTEVSLFNPAGETPCLLAAGDDVKFVDIDRKP